MYNKERGCAASSLIIFSIAVQLQHRHEGLCGHLDGAQIPHLLFACERIFDPLTGELYFISRRTAAGALPRAGRQKDQSLSSFSTAMKASVGTWTVPKFRIFFLPSFCFSSSFFLRVISPP